MISAVPFEEVTEATGLAVTEEAASMIATRYLFAAGFASARSVLEVACGSGIGLGLLAQSAQSVVGCDLNASLLVRAANHYGKRIPLVQLSASDLPFLAESFDLVLDRKS